jgi:hypothetical protein
LKTDIRKFRAHKQRGALIVFFAASAGGLLWANHADVRAIAWHCIHGNYAEVADRRVNLPLLWWKGDDDFYQDTVLVRACNSCGAVQPEVLVSPARPGQMSSSDEDQLRAVQKMIAVKNGSKTGLASSSLVTIRSPAFVLYCEKDEQVSAISNLPDSVLFCNAANLPYLFSFYGDPHVEKEVESILSTLR